MQSAVRDRLIGSNPCEGVRLPRNRKQAHHDSVISLEELTGQLLPVVPPRYRALVALAGGTGLRWGECVGLRWSEVDLTAHCVKVVRVAVEVAGTVTTKPYPKTRAGLREVPLPPFVVAELQHHKDAYSAGKSGEVFTNSENGPVRRTLFRSRVWRPALVRARLLGKVVHVAPDAFHASWLDSDGVEHEASFVSEREAVKHVAKVAAGGMTFHGLRRSYATHLVSNNVAINDVAAVMGHERFSTTLDIYTKRPKGRNGRVLDAFPDDDDGETEPSR